jgi:predicted phage tail protein
MVKRRFGLFTIILGAILIVLGFIYEGILAGIPYQDPTTELLQKYMHYVNIGQTLYKFGIPLLFAGLLIALIQKIIKPLNKHR